MRNAGDEVTITVEYLRDAPSFLKLPLGKGGKTFRAPVAFPVHHAFIHMDGSD